MYGFSVSLYLFVLDSISANSIMKKGGFRDRTAGIGFQFDVSSLNICMVALTQELSGSILSGVPPCMCIECWLLVSSFHFSIFSRPLCLHDLMS